MNSIAISIGISIIILTINWELDFIFSPSNSIIKHDCSFYCHFDQELDCYFDCELDYCLDCELYWHFNNNFDYQMDWELDSKFDFKQCCCHFDQQLDCHFDHEYSAKIQHFFFTLKFASKFIT